MDRPRQYPPTRKRTATKTGHTAGRKIPQKRDRPGRKIPQRGPSQIQTIKQFEQPHVRGDRPRRQNHLLSRDPLPTLKKMTEARDIALTYPTL